MQTDLTRVQTGYDLWSKIYDEESNPLIALEDRVVWQRIGDVHGLNVLDLGCGTGRHSQKLQAFGAKVTAVDFSKKMLAQARNKPDADGIQYVEHDLCNPLPFEKEMFDLVVSGLVLEHLPAIGPLFAEAHRVLKPRGRAVFTAMHPAMFLRGTQARFTDPDSGELVMPGSISHPLDEFVRAPLHAGFSLTEIAEFVVDEELAHEHPRALKYLGCPILLVLVLQKERLQPFIDPLGPDRRERFPPRA